MHLYSCQHHLMNYLNLDGIKTDNKKRSIKKNNVKSLLVKPKQEFVREQVICEICPILDLTTSSSELRSHRVKKHKNGEQFDCPHCDKKFDRNWNNLLHHISSNHPEHYEKKFFCQICDEYFIFSCTYLRHKRTAREQKIHICNLCENESATKCALNEHMILKHDSGGAKFTTMQESVPEQVICEICPILDLTTYSYQLRSHKIKKHKNGNQYCCPHCDVKLDSKLVWSSLLRHVSSTHSDKYEKKYACKICDKSFIFSFLHSHHEKFAHADKKHVCDTCRNNFTSLWRLKEHILLKHNSEGATKLFCEKCGFSTISKVNLRRHMDARHNKEKHKKCPYCEFSSLHNQKVHVHIDINHPEKEDNNFLCNKCDRAFTYKASFSDHSKYKCIHSDYYLNDRKKQAKKHIMKKRKLTNPILFQCDYCYEVIKATTSNLIKKHYKLHHRGQPIIAENQEKFECSNCDDVFLFEDELNRHRNLAHGIKTERNYCPQCKMSYVELHTCQKGGETWPPKNKGLKYPCDRCSKTFSSKSHLIKTDHEKQLDFECTTCSKKVGSKTQLSNHIFRCHSQVPCEICNKEIANPYDLKKHKLIVHKDTTGVWLCESCPKSAFFTKSMFVKHMKEKHKHLVDIKGLDC